jgi:hypothetical protein
MRTESTHRRNAIRVLLVACISVLGLITIVGSGGGGSLGFPPCTDPVVCNGNVPPPQASATIDPPYITALVGSPVSYAVQTANTTGTLSYQWRRSTDGGNTYVDIAGATSTTYSIASVNLADDAAVFRVDVRSIGVLVLQPVAHLAVSSVPGLVFQDDEFLAANWQVSPVPDSNGLEPGHVEESLATGGNPGAFRKMTFQIPAGAGSARVFYSSVASTYDPSAQGGIYVIDYAEDCIAFQNSTTTYTESNLVIEQGGRRFLSSTFDNCVATTWSTVVKRASLAPADFRLFDGPACTAGEACPDFSGSAAPMRLGYWRISFGVPGGSIAHGIDNWKVTVWRR